MFFKKKKKTCLAIVPAAGSSSRMKEFGNKLFLEVGGIPVILRTLQVLQSCSEIDAIIIPTREDSIEEISALCKNNSIDKVKAVVAGGKSRTESVLKGILASDKKFDLIAIHDAARPFVSFEIIEKTVSAARYYHAAAPGVSIKDTVKQVKGELIEKTIPRETLCAIQTPQVFDADIITAALVKAIDEDIPITDDCSAVENIGMKVFITEGSYLNIKITTPEDILFAEVIAANQEKRG
ncbi:MAG: 2-C-methyl-D-erythritol 4-phosphate cytidylyltransferase [Oscillospiraceae bacterium]|nr:2-C-methyl-D-erythritol 4-phosphate cytidylyltransferase [Oscillospiraceae bacterium]